MFDYRDASVGGRWARSQGRMSGTLSYGLTYPSPFFDVAHTYLPDTVKQMFRWCRYYYLTNPLIAATVNKMSEYPITDIVVDTENDGLADHWRDFFDNVLKLRAFLIDIGLYFQCFHGDTTVVTDKGVFKIRELSGGTHNVLSEGGVYRSARFKSYGRQKLWKVTFGDKSSVLATSDHLWPVTTATGSVIKLPTTKIQGRSVFRTVAPRPNKDDDFYEGVRHGFVFGDGSHYNNRSRSRADFHGHKKAMIKYYEGHGGEPKEGSDGRVRIHGLPIAYKSLPDNESSASYWYGFVCGFLAADGSVDSHGCVILTQKNREVLEKIAEQLPRFGIIGGPIRGYEMAPRTINGKEIKAEGDMHFMTLFKQFMEADDLLLPRHRECFEKKYEPSKYGKMARVLSVEETDLEDEVFCCTEDKTNTFVVGNGVLTGNCYGNAIVSIYYPFTKFLKCRHCGHTTAAKKAQYRFHSFRFILSCSKCGASGECDAEDVYIRSQSRIRLILWNPEDITINHNPTTGEDTFYYSIPKPIKNDIIMGKRDTLETIPQLFIDAVKRQKGIVLSPDNVYHFKRPSILSGAKDRGWGCPLLLPVLKDTFYLQILKKANEAIALERVYPLNIVFPQPGSGTSDPFSTISLVKWRDQVINEIQRWRQDRAYIPVMPLPLGQQLIGGDGRALLLAQEIKIWSDQIIAGMGVPQEFVFGGLQWSGSNVSLRMLENHFLRYNSDLLAFIRVFLIPSISTYMDWPEVSARFKPFKMADDMQRKAYMFQLNQAGKLSDSAILSDADFDPVKEDEMIEKEMSRRLEATKKQQLAQAEVQGETQVVMAKYQAKAQTAQQQELLQAQQGTQGAAPGEPLEGIGRPGQQQQPDQAPPQPATPQMAQQVAQQLAGAPPQMQQQLLAQISQQNPQLAQMVASMLQQGGGGGASNAAAKPLPSQLPPRRGAESALI